MVLFCSILFGTSSMTHYLLFGEKHNNFFPNPLNYEYTFDYFRHIFLGWSVCHNFLKGWEVFLPCSYRSTFIICYLQPTCMYLDSFRHHLRRSPLRQLGLAAGLPKGPRPRHDYIT